MKTEESRAYVDVLGRRKRFGGGSPDPCPDSSGRDRFKPAPCSGAGGFISSGVAPESLLSIVSSGAAPEPSPSVISRGAAPELLPFIVASGTAGLLPPTLRRSWRGVAPEPRPALVPRLVR